QATLPTFFVWSQVGQRMLALPSWAWRSAGTWSVLLLNMSWPRATDSRASLVPCGPPGRIIQDRDGNTRSKSKAGRSGKGSCTDCRTVLYASPNHKLENFNERYRLWVLKKSL